ncbi:REP-associated tyrosine transposase [Aeromonas sp. 80P]
MANWRRAWRLGGIWFFTVNLLERSDNQLLVTQIDLLRHTVAKVKQTHPFTIHAWVVLPDHLHCILSLSEGDTDFPLRWRSYFSRALPITERRSQTRLRHGERGIWQRHYWEHLIRDEEDYRRHMDYVHINPLKHGYVTQVGDWPYSTFHRYVASGIYPPDWCGAVDQLQQEWE